MPQVRRPKPSDKSVLRLWGGIALLGVLSLAVQASEDIATGVTLFKRGQFAAAQQFFAAFDSQHPTDPSSLAGTQPTPKRQPPRLPSGMRQLGKKPGSGVSRMMRKDQEQKLRCLGEHTGERISKSEKGVRRRMQQQPKKELHDLETNPLGRTFSLRQTLTIPPEESKGTKPERFPDFFLIGAPRCGTTSLSRYLADNPQVCFSRPKEPHFFSLLAPHAALDDLETAYLARYFFHYREGHKAIGEGSVSYLPSPYALQRILRINPHAKFIAIVRNPLDMLPSYHQRMRFVVMEDVEDFATAWRLQEVRARGERIPKHCIDPHLLWYREVGKFGEQVERLYHLAGRDQSLVLLFEDFVRDPGAVYRQVLAFIGVDDDGRTRFQRKLESKIYRYRWLQQVLYAPLVRKVPFVDTVHRRMNQKKASGRKSWLKRVARWNTINMRPAPLDPAMRKTLRDTFATDVDKLSNLLQRDLSHWLMSALLWILRCVLTSAAILCDYVV